MTNLTLTDAEEFTLASALRHEYDHRSKLRGYAERGLARDPGDAEDWTSAAAKYECELATLDGLIAKMPTWVAKVVTAK